MKNRSEQLRILSVSSMYTGSLENFYRAIPSVSEMTYADHYNLLLDFSTDFTSSYIKSFQRLGLTADAVIANDKALQKKWAKAYLSSKCSDSALLFSQISYYKPDILWIEDLRFTSQEFLNEIKQKVKSIKLLAAYHCAPFNTVNTEKLKLFDFVITCTPGLMDELKGKGIKSFLVYHGFDANILPKLKPALTNNPLNVLFSGSLFQGPGYHQGRLDFIEHLLLKGVDVSLYINIESRLKILAKRFLHIFRKTGKRIGIERPEKVLPVLEYGSEPVRKYSGLLLEKIKSPVYGLEMYQLLHNSKIVLNIHGDIAGKYAGNIRMFEATGAGSCLLTDKKENLHELFEENNEIVVFDDVNDCIRKIEWLLENENIRSEIAIAGQKKTLNSHTVDKRCSEIIAIFNDELKNAGKLGIENNLATQV